MFCLTPATRLVGVEVKWIVVDVGTWATATVTNVAQAKRVLEKCISSGWLSVCLNDTSVCKGIDQLEG